MNKKTFKYNYVICGSGGYYLVGYHDVMNHPQICYHASHTDGLATIWQQVLCRLNFSKKVNRYIHTPFSYLLYPRLYPHQFDNHHSLCFLFFGNVQYVYQTSYLDYIRNRYPGAKIVLYMQDLIKRNTELDFEKVRNKFDLILSYDKGDSEQYNLLFHPTPMSYVEVAPDEMIADSDIYFCGYAKNRYDEILEVYHYCKERGLRCDFNVMGLSDADKKVEGINYPNHSFSYIENLQHVVKSHCVLEIMQKNADGFTPRLWESIMYDKHLLTNNPSVASSEYDVPDNIHIYDPKNMVDIREWIEKPVTYPAVLKQSLSPLHLIEFVDMALINK